MKNCLPSHQNIINCDANACYGLLPEVQSMLNEWNLEYANPSAVHRLGQKARAIIEEARSELGLLLKLSPTQRIVFTSGASEALNQAIMFPYWQKNFGTWVTSQYEHPAVLEPYKRLNSLGMSTKLIDCTQDVAIHPNDLSSYLNEKTVCLALMYANNETGAISLIPELFQIAKDISPNILTVCDAVQAIGKIEVDCSHLSADFIAISGHKFGALTGVGALIVNDHLPAAGLILGGPQELSWRAGTENLIGIHSLGIAAKVIRNNFLHNQQRYQELQSFIVSHIHQDLPDTRINSQNELKLMNTISLEIPGVKADDLVVALDLAGYAVSSGSACSSGKPSPSHVLLGLGRSEEQARSTLRISFRPDLTLQQAEQLIQLIKNYRLN